MELAHELTLLERATLALEFSRRDPFRSGVVDEWQIKEWVRGVVYKCLGHEVGDKDLVRHSGGNSPSWKLLLWNPDFHIVQQRLIPLLQGSELNVGGIRLHCSVISETTTSYSDNLKGTRTMSIKGLPCRWFADPSISTQASPNVARAIFSEFGSIKNLEIVADDDQLQCTIWIQYEHSSDLVRALQALGGRAMQKRGSSLKANYTLHLDRDDYFDGNNVRKRRFEREHAQKLANDARLADAHRAALEQRRAEQERLVQAQRQEEENRLRKEQEEADRMLKLQIEEQRRREEEALKEQQIQMEMKLREEEERQKMEELRQAEVERKNQQIREATRKLLEEQEQQRKASEEGEQESNSMIERGRWQLYLDEDCTPWPTREVQHTTSKTAARGRKRLNSIIVQCL